MIDTCSKRGNQLQLVAGGRDQIGINPVSHGRDQDIGLLDDGVKLFG